MDISTKRVQNTGCLMTPELLKQVRTCRVVRGFLTYLALEDTPAIYTTVQGATIHSVVRISGLSYDQHTSAWSVLMATDM